MTTESAVATEPEQFVATRFRCPHCRRSWSSKKLAADHMGRCWRNPAARACKTCAHYFLHAAEPDVGYVGEEGCDLGVQWPESLRGVETLAVHCEQWEADSSD